MKYIPTIVCFLVIVSLVTIFSCEKQTFFYDSSGQMKKDIQIIDQYLADNHIVALKSQSGLRYVIRDPGFGDFATVGKTVTMHYRGTLLDSTEFDNSYDNAVPMSFVLGNNQVIAGIDEGVQYVRAGGKITLYIPSPLAYGRQSEGPVITPNSILVFYIDVLSVSF
jgi:FKBP-type peptidyl-prolyl cis-trans isomerase FkpA